MEQKEKYHGLLRKNLEQGKTRENRKGTICCLLNERMELTTTDLFALSDDTANKAAVKLHYAGPW